MLLPASRLQVCSRGCFKAPPLHPPHPLNPPLPSPECFSLSVAVSMSVPLSVRLSVGLSLSFSPPSLVWRRQARSGSSLSSCVRWMHIDRYCCTYCRTRACNQLLAQAEQGQHKRERKLGQHKPGEREG